MLLFGICAYCFLAALRERRIGAPVVSEALISSFALRCRETIPPSGLPSVVLLKYRSELVALGPTVLWPENGLRKLM